MNNLLILGAVVLIAALLIGALIMMAKAVGESNALREEAERARRNAEAAGKEMAQHRTTGDSTKRLQDGSF